MLAVALVTVVAGSASAAGGSSQSDPECASWDGDLTAVVAGGPGVVSVQGWGRAQVKPNLAPCTAPPLAVAHSARNTVSPWISTGVLASVPVTERDTVSGRFRQLVNVPIGTRAVCVAVGNGASLGCWEVRVDADASGAADVPVIGRELPPPYVRVGPPQTPDPNCGTCV